ncbi:MAG: hypothetical protein GF350_07535 [Chitinivibrionales bacterium]|nr:hypothetical protein [Chitinivibrionales bacterium]
MNCTCNAFSMKESCMGSYEKKSGNRHDQEKRKCELVQRYGPEEAKTILKKEQAEGVSKFHQPPESLPTPSEVEECMEDPGKPERERAQGVEPRAADEKTGQIEKSARKAKKRKNSDNQ